MDTTYNFKSASPSATVFEIVESDPKGGASFSDGGAAHKKTLMENLNKFKLLVETETVESNPDTGAKKKKWWPF
jgi:hypothetical protein